MTIYIVQGNYTQEALAGMVAKPEDRALSVEPLIKAAGGKLLGYYVTYGEYDFLAVVDGGRSADNIMGALMAAGATGGVTNLRTTIGVTSKEAMKAMRAGKKLRAGFKPAGQPA